MKYLSDPPSHEVSNTFITIKVVLETRGSLDIFQNLSELTCFKTEVKKKPGVPDDVEGIAMEAKARGVASKALSLLASELLSNAPSFVYGESFSNIPSMMPSLLVGLQILSIKFSDEAAKDSILEELNDILSCLAVVTGYSEASHELLLSSDCLQLFPRFLTESKLRLNTLRVYRALFKTFSSLAVISTLPNHLDALYESIESTSQILVVTFGSQSTAAPAKGKKVSNHILLMLSVEVVEKIFIFSSG